MEKYGKSDWKTAAITAAILGATTILGVNSKDDIARYLSRKQQEVHVEGPVSNAIQSLWPTPEYKGEWRTYAAESGDTLWPIARKCSEKYGGDARDWVQIIYVHPGNEELKRNPYLQTNQEFDIPECGYPEAGRYVK